MKRFKHCFPHLPLAHTEYPTYRGRRRAERGSPAVELALAAPIFLFMVMAVIDISIYAWRDSGVRAAAEAGARLLRTGEIANATHPETLFVSTICGATAAVNCNELYYDVRPYANFGAVDFSPVPLDDTGKPEALQFTSGDANQIVAVRLMTPHRFVTPFLDDFVGGDGRPPYLESTIIVRGEPWTS